jgi:hypothetical protein
VGIAIVAYAIWVGKGPGNEEDGYEEFSRTRFDPCAVVKHMMAPLDLNMMSSLVNLAPNPRS